jgi:hypothetical protein
MAAAATAIHLVFHRMNVSPFAKLRHVPAAVRSEARERRGSLARERGRRFLCGFLFARCQEDFALGIKTQAATLKLLMRQFVTQMSVFRSKVCAS